jgi:hypothetical protein
LEDRISEGGKEVMREALSVVCLIVTALCAIGVFNIAAQAGGKSDLSDRRSVFQREYEKNQRVASNPWSAVLIIVGLASAVLGMYLLGMMG